MNTNSKKIIGLLSEEMDKFDGLSEFVQKLAAEIHRCTASGDYENTSILLKELVVVLEVLGKHKTLDRKGAITAPDVDNLQPKLVSYLTQIVKDDSVLKVWSAANVDVNLKAALMGS
jgi:hypothetical protein